MHERLLLVKGVAAAPGDTNSAEQGLETVDFMNPLGFMLDEWAPQIAGLKNGGVWADSQVDTGRRLVAGADGNVTETIRLTVQRADYGSLYTMISRLQRFVLECRQMWTTFHQIEPVFLCWKAIGAPDAQYALVFSIDVDVAYPDVAQSPAADITLSLEREPYWRALPPGMSPMAWAYYARGQSYTAADLNIDASDNSFVNSGFRNRTIIATAPPNFTEDNWIDIDGATIPGDAPALTSIVFADEGIGAGFLVNQAYVARITKPAELDGSYLYNTLNACNGQLGTDAATATDSGATQDLAGNAERVNVTFATVATDAERVDFTPITGLPPSLWRGRYAAFVRARQTGGASGDIKMHLQIQYSDTGDALVLDEVSPSLITGTGNTTVWGLSYLGTFTTPLDRRINTYTNGLGVDAPGDVFELQLYARRTTGTGVLYLCDLILMPFDEAMCAVVGSQLTGNGPTGAVWMDNTGYALHGDVGDYAAGVRFGINVAIRELGELRGQSITLEPGVDNRLYFLLNGEDSGVIGSATNAGCTLWIDIVPRWRGVRNV